MMRRMAEKLTALERPESPTTLSVAADTVSVVICAHDERRWEAIGRAVESLHAQTRPLHQVIVVVDHNPDLFARVAGQLTGIVAIQNEGARGLSAARNAGTAIATGTLVAFLDDDATARPDWVERLADACRDPELIGAGGRSVPNWLDREPAWFPEEFLWAVGCTYRGMPDEPTRVRNIFGGCFCIRREALEELGGFLSEFGRVGTQLMCNEETELCIRASRRWPGRGFLYDPGAVIEHEVPGSRITLSYFRRRCFAEGVSKGRLSRHVGVRSGLESERVHAAQTIPAGILREIALGLRRGEPSRFARAAAIAVGLAVTAAGYAVGLARPVRTTA